jgi:hypothetical protein
MKKFCLIITVLMMASIAAASQPLLTPAASPVGALRDNYTGSLGMLFKVNDHVTVDRLGFYDHNGDGNVDMEDWAIFAGYWLK